MLNQVVLVGRLTAIEENYIIIKSVRPYKNSNGEYDSDEIKCYVSPTIYENAKEYCEFGNVIGIKGRIENNNNELIISAEKITFLSSGKKEKNNE